MSLIEGLVVLAIAGLIGLVAFPQLDRPYRVLDLRSGAQTLSIDLRRTRAAALRGDKEAALVPAKDGRGYVLADGTKRTLPAGTTLKGQRVRFFPDGTATGGTFEISGMSKTIHVIVADGTGAVSLVIP